MPYGDDDRNCENTTDIKQFCQPNQQTTATTQRNNKTAQRKCIHNMRNGKGARARARACAKTDPVKQSEMSVPAMEGDWEGGREEC